MVPAAWIHQVTSPALVLGSTQPDATVDGERARGDGVEVVRRRSGGGLVTLVPGNDLWVDLVIPRHSPLWHPDVGRAFAWVGTAWATALRSLLEPDDAAMVAVHHGPLTERAAGRILCFAGLGPGEVTVAGRKVVGLSLRRWRDGARFQCAMTWWWQPDLVARYLHPDLAVEVEAATGLALDRLPVGLPRPGSGPTPAAAEAALLAALPPAG